MSDVETRTLYRLEGAGRRFGSGDTQVRAVDGVDLMISAGEFVAIQGPSGSGKSTLLQLLGALDQATEGSVRLDDRELSALGDRELTRLRRSEIGFVFQSFNLIPTLTAAENVEVAMMPLIRSRGARRERAAELLALVGLASRADHLPSKLSGGEQQRVAMARALANEPRVMLADEPTGNLDSATADEVVSALGDLSGSRGVTVILVTHADEISRKARRRLRMRDGRLLEDSAWAP